MTVSNIISFEQWLSRFCSVFIKSFKEYCGSYQMS